MNLEKLREFIKSNKETLEVVDIDVELLFLKIRMGEIEKLNKLVKQFRDDFQEVVDYRNESNIGGKKRFKRAIEVLDAILRFSE